MKDNSYTEEINKILEKLNKYFPEHKVFALDNIDKKLAEKISNISKTIGYESVEKMLSNYGFEKISGEKVRKLRKTVIYTPGNEPEIIKSKVESICNRLNEYYPDRTILRGIQNDHKALSSSISGVYQWLGYKNASEFLKAYGYDYQIESNSGGRPNETNPKQIIEALKEQYKDGPKFYKMSELIAENQDLEGKIKTISNQANKLFGMTIKDYFIQQGILKEKQQVELKPTLTEEKEKIKKQNEKEKLNYLVNELRKRYENTGKRLPKSLNELTNENRDLYVNTSLIEKYFNMKAKDFYIEEGLIQKKAPESEGSGIIELFTDGKTVVNFKSKTKKGKEIIKIPSGVEVIDNTVFVSTKIKELYINKELTSIGKYTLNNKYGQPKSISTIEVEEGNKHFSVDEIGLYSILENGQKQLEYVINTRITSYTTPKGVVSFAKNVFANCKNLEKIILSEDFKYFEESACLGVIKKIYIPKNVEKIYPLFQARYYGGEDILEYDIDEENEHIFIDEDSIYEVLADGTYKLVSYLYQGKGEPLILEGTSQIGKGVFCGCEGFSTIELPSSVKIIEEYAFEGTSLKSITIPNGIEEIAEEAFANCEELRTVTIPSTVKTVADNAFIGCDNLKEIKSDIKEKVFLFEDGVITKICNNTRSIGNREKLDQLAKKLINEIESLSINTLNNRMDKAIYDGKKHILRLNTALTQYSEDENIQAKRIAIAETIHENEPVKVNLKSAECIEIVTLNNDSIGEIKWVIAGELFPYFNAIEIKNAHISRVIPYSKREKNTKNAFISIEMEIEEHIINIPETREEITAREQFIYNIDNLGVHILGWIGKPSEKVITFPSTIEGRKVVEICPKIFTPSPYVDIKKPYNVEEIIISEGIEKIAEETIYGIEKLKKVVFPSSIKYISPKVFSDANGNYKDLYLSDKTMYIAPSGSYAEAFLKSYKPDSYNVNKLLVIPEDSEEMQEIVKNLMMFEIEKNEIHFKDSYKVKNFNEKVVKVPDNINGKNFKTFDIYGILNFIEKIIIPKGIIKIKNLDSKYLFYEDGKKLERIEIAEDNPAYWSDGYAIYSKNKEKLIRFLSFTSSEYTVFEETKEIGDRAFIGMVNLKSLALPATLQQIGDEAFSECQSLSEIIGLENVKDIGKQTLEGTPFKQKKPIIQVGKALVKYGNYSEQTVALPNGIEKICSFAFSQYNENDLVEKIVLPDTVKIIEEGAFAGRKKLKQINIPEGVKGISKRVFSNCHSLEEIKIPASVENVDIDAFPEDDPSDEKKSVFNKIIVEPNNKYYCSIDGVLFSKDKSILYYVPQYAKIEKFIIPSEVKIIEKGAFFGNRNITEIVFSEGNTIIKDKAFSECEKLKTIKFSNSIISIGKYAFWECNSLEEIEWSKNLKTIEDYAFENTALKEINLPDTLESIGAESFAKTSCEYVVLPKSVKKLGYGIFTGCTEIGVYDCIEDTDKDCNIGVDTCNGNPNSLIGYIGIGGAWARWDCAANHEWLNYTITVISSENNQIKYKVWMGADGTQRDYYCFLASAWGKNATFNFEFLDKFFPKIRGKHNKIIVAKYRLEYPIQLSDEMKKKYEEYLSKNQ